MFRPHFSISEQLPNRTKIWMRTGYLFREPLVTENRTGHHQAKGTFAQKPNTSGNGGELTQIE